MSKNLLIDRLIKVAGKESRAQILTEDILDDKNIICDIDVPIVNIIMSGDLNGGLIPGNTILLGPSRSFKTNFCLLLVKNFLNYYEDGVCIFVDSEHGATKYFNTFNIDLNRIIHIPIENIEELQFQLTRMVKEVSNEEHVIIFIDSISQLPSIREVNNALTGNEAVDLSRPKALNSFWRTITPMINLRKIPLLAINSYYESMGNPYAEATMAGGKQGFLSADTILMVSRSQEKDADKNVKGFNFTYTILKSRYVVEKSKFKLNVTFSGGIEKYSGLFDILLESGLLYVPTQGWYSLIEHLDSQQKKYRRKDIEFNEEFWIPLLQNKVFLNYITDNFSLENQCMIKDYIVDENGEILRK